MASAGKVDVWNRALHKVQQTTQIQDESENTPAAKSCNLVYDDIVGLVLRAFPWRWARREKALTSINTQTETFAYASLVNPYDTFVVPFPFISSSQVAVTHIDGSAVETELTAGTDYTFDETDSGLVTCTLATPLQAGESVQVDVETSRVGWDYVYTLPSDCARALALLPEGTRYDQIAPEDRLEFEVMLGDDGQSFILCTNETSSTFAAFAYTANVTDVRAWPRDFLEAVVWRLAAELADGLAKDVKRADRCMKMYEYVLNGAANVNEREGHVSWQTTPGLAVR